MHDILNSERLSREMNESFEMISEKRQELEKLVAHDFELKIDWAAKRAGELHASLEEFIDRKPYLITEKQDPKTGEHFYYAAQTEDIPDYVRLMTGDVIQNLRSALDHLVCALVDANGGKVTDATGFPIFKNMPNTTEQKAIFNRKVNGMRAEAIEYIRSTKPYQTGNRDLWRLHRLNITDKHRLLLTAGVGLGQFNFGQHMRETRKGRIRGHVPDYWISANQIVLAKTPRPIIIDPPDAELNKNMQLTFEVALNEIGVCEGVPVRHVLKTSLHWVRGIAMDCLRFL